MPFNLLESVRNLFSGDLINKAAVSLGESEGNVSKSISGIIPTILGGLVSKVSSGQQHASSILDMVKNASESGVLSNVSNLFSQKNSNIQSLGTGALNQLFGDKVSRIANIIAGFGGIKESSAASLMSTAAPAALGVLGKHVSENNLNASGLVNFLVSQKDSILNAIPHGLSSSLGSLLGLGSIPGAISSAAGTIKDKAGTSIRKMEDAVENSGTQRKILVPVILGLLALILLIFFLRKGCNGDKNEVQVPPATTDTITQKPAVVEPSGPASIKVKLPDGVELDAYKGGIEDQLVSFLLTEYTKLGADSLKKIWFDFDNLSFKTGSADITTESQKQLDNISAILKAFPKTKIKIGGYTDKTGDESVNKKLSNGRANAVKAALEKAGKGSQVVGAEGYGSEFAKYAKDAPEEDRKKDRHVSVNVRQ